MQRRESRTAQIAELGVLTAAALIIFVIENQIPSPVPIPGVKLGLANIITVYAVYHYKWSDALLLVLVRVILGSVFAGTMISFAFSISGALLCLAGMIPISKLIGEKYIWLSSVMGAVLHNAGQTAAAVAVMKTTAVIGYLPYLMISGCIAGAFTGLAAQLVTVRLDSDRKKGEKSSNDDA